MKLVKIGIGAIVIVIIGCFTYIAVTDVPLEQNSVSITINNERFFDESTN